MAATDGIGETAGSSETMQTVHYTDGIRTLTSRQHQVLIRLMSGASNKEIARDLSISPFTVRTYVSAILCALGVKTRGEAAEYARRLGLEN